MAIVLRVEDNEELLQGGRRALHTLLAKMYSFSDLELLRIKNWTFSVMHIMTYFLYILNKHYQISLIKYIQV